MSTGFVAVKKPKIWLDWASVDTRRVYTLDRTTTVPKVRYLVIFCLLYLVVAYPQALLFRIPCNKHGMESYINVKPRGEM